MFKPQMELVNNNFSLEVEKGARLPEMMLGDHIRLKQVLINLTKNALNSTAGGEIQIKISYEAQSEFLYCHVSDTGLGFSNEGK